MSAQRSQYRPGKPYRGRMDARRGADDPRLDGFPAGFFSRQDESTDDLFYRPDRLVTHIDDHAIETVGRLYRELDLCGPGSGPVLDLMSSWISHFPTKPQHLTVLGMNHHELAANDMADDRVVQDLNTEPILPFHDGHFAGAVCCVSVDYLTRPLAVFDEVARVLQPGGVFACTFSNRCFPTKAIAGWLGSDDETRVAIVGAYFGLSSGWDAAEASRLTPPGHRGDPLYAVLARRSR